MKKKILILGSGIAGCIAYHTFRSESVQIIEAKEKPKDKIDHHAAIMRLRNEDVAKFIGADCKKISITKAIYYQGKVEVQSNLQLNNLYSIKLYDEIGKRSILNLNQSERFILTNGFPIPENIIFGERVIKINKNEVITAGGNSYDFDFCISTLPMSILYDQIAPPNFDEPIGFHSSEIYVIRFSIEISCSVNQTIYYPDKNIPIYRITLQNKVVIVESIKKFDKALIDYSISLFCKSFGIDAQYLSSLPEENSQSELKIGKIRSIPENMRIRYILWLTDHLNVYSFGRFSVWKPLRTDELLDDISKIKKIISAKDVEIDYKLRLRRASENG